jgi:hypothetical protein
MSAVIKAEAYGMMRRVIETGKHYAMELAKSDKFLRPIVQAEALNTLRHDIGPDCIAVLRSMENTPLGFRTDKEGGYPDHVLRDVMIMAMLDGLGFSGNMFNIIAGAYYVTKEGWAELLDQLGATNVVAYASLPEPGDVTEAVAGNAKKYTVKMGGYAECRFFRRGNTEGVWRAEMRRSDGFDTRRMISGYGRDLAEAMNGIAGKAEATLLKKLYYTISGKPEPVESSEPIVIDVEPEAAPLITAKPVEQATDEQVEMYQKCVRGIEDAANVTMLSVAWEAVNSLKKSKALTDDQIKQLTSLKDIRKQALK